MTIDTLKWDNIDFHLLIIIRSFKIATWFWFLKHLFTMRDTGNNFA